MITSNATGTDPFPHTVYYEDGEQVWPCRCGETHRGEYGKMDWLHHECFHDEILLMPPIAPGMPCDLGLCTACGKAFRLVYPTSAKEKNGHM